MNGVVKYLAKDKKSLSYARIFVKWWNFNPYPIQVSRGCTILVTCAGFLLIPCERGREDEDDGEQRVNDVFYFSIFNKKN